MDPQAPSLVSCGQSRVCMYRAAGKTLAENLAVCPDLTAGQQVIQPLEAPIKSSGHLQILYGNLAPAGSVAKITGKEGLQFRGPARVFDSEEEMLAIVFADPQELKVGSEGFGLGDQGGSPHIGKRLRA